MAGGIDALGAEIGELAIKVVPDTGTFGADVSKGVGASVQSASRVALGAVAAVGGGLFALGTQLDDAYDNIRANTKATGDDLVALNASFDAVAKNVPSSLGEVSEAVATISTRLGLTGEGVEAVATQMLQLSHVTGEDLTGTLDAASTVLNQFGVKGKEITGVLDNIFQVSKASGVGFTELSTQLAKSGGALQGLGFTLDESIDFLGLLGKNGVDANKAVLGLGKTIQGAVEAGVPARQALGDLFATIRDSTDDTVAAGLAQEVFGARAGPQLAQAIREGTLSLDDLKTSLGANEDTIEGVAAETADFAETLAKTKNQLALALGPAANKLFTTIGESAAGLAPALVMVVEAITPLITAFASLPAPVLAGVIGLLTVGATLTKLMKPIMAVIQAVKLLTVVAMTNPWIILIAATVALGIVIFKNWDKIKEVVGGAIDFINGKFKMIKKIWAPLISGDWYGVGEVVDNIFGNDGKFIRPIRNALQRMEDIFNSVKQFFADWSQRVIDVFNRIGEMLQPAVNVVQAIWSFAFNSMATFVETWIGRLTALFTNLTTWIGGAFNMIAAVVVPIWQGMWDTLAAITSTVWGAITAIVGGAISAVTAIIDALRGPIGLVSGAFGALLIIGTIVWNTLKSVIGGVIDWLIERLRDLKEAAEDALGPLGKAASFVGGKIGTGAGWLKDLAGFDTGGIVPGPTGAARLILAHGGETVLPTHKAPLDAFTGNGGPSGGTVITVTFAGDVIIRDDRDVVETGRMLAREAETQMRAQGLIA